MDYELFGQKALLMGILADRYGSQRLIIACLTRMELPFLILSITTSGISLISKGVDDWDTTFAYHRVAGNIGIALGPLLTAVPLLAFDWRIVSCLLMLSGGTAVLYVPGTSFDEGAAVSVDGKMETSPPISLLGSHIQSAAVHG